MIKRTNGQLNIQQKMNMTTIKLKRYILISLTKIYLDLIIDCKAGDRLYFIYRIIIIVLFIYTFINNNPSLLLELLDNLNYNYLNQLYDDSFIKINRGKFSYTWNEFNQRSRGYNNGSGGPNHNPNPSLYEVENTRKRLEEENKQSGEPSRMQFKPSELENVRLGDNPSRVFQFCYYSSVEKRMVYPEDFHPGLPILLNHDRFRVYIDNGISYTYNYRSLDPSQHYCMIEYLDGSKCYLNDASKIAANIEYHRRPIKDPS